MFTMINIKRGLKIFGVVLIVSSAGFGIYKGYKYLKNKK